MLFLVKKKEKKYTYIYIRVFVINISENTIDAYHEDVGICNDS